MNYKKLEFLTKNLLIKKKIDEKLGSYLIDNLFNFSELDKINNIKINKEQFIKYNFALQKLIKGEPIQYIIGTVNFYGYEFNINESVLIPRFETEELVFETLLYIKKYFKNEVSILDIGTGSGVIGLTLKKEIPNSNVTLTDISSDILKQAKANAKNLNVKVNIIKSDIFKNIPKEKYNIIISNPPYIKEDTKIMKIVNNYEPKIALYGGQDGLNFYRRILKEAPFYLEEKCLIALEISDEVLPGILKILKNNFLEYSYEIKKDMQKRKRMIFIFRNLND
ncbi:MAG: peptide chain release factor N(5)-glutamine methyltransferase [Bacilli bacterium]|jgi:release factor glutamine methyltransferase